MPNKFFLVSSRKAFAELLFGRSLSKADVVQCHKHNVVRFFLLRRQSGETVTLYNTDVVKLGKLTCRDRYMPKSHFLRKTKMADRWGITESYFLKLKMRKQ